MIYQKISSSPRKQIAVLIDPDKHTDKSLDNTIDIAVNAKIDYFFVGGSFLVTSIDTTILKIKEKCDIPVILFPGNQVQISDKADAILFLSLISGRNPEFLITNHVLAAPKLAKLNIEIIPTGYILIESGKRTAVEYVSNTNPIPRDKTEIAVATALAGQMLGLKMIYLESGSGAYKTVPKKMIKKVKEHLNIPLIVGGGINSSKKLEKICKAGADLIVVGNWFEKNPEAIGNFAKIVHSF